jgi:hypothetical protein
MAMELEQLYEQHIKSLPTAERLRLIEKIVSDLATQSSEFDLPKRRPWREICGAAPYPRLERGRTSVGLAHAPRSRRTSGEAVEA